MTNPSTQFKEGNKAAVKSPKIVIRKFTELMENAKEDAEILSWYDACSSIGWRSTKADYWAEKLSVFGNIKKEVQNIIAARVNKQALKGNFSAAPSIWRMKQCGESDERVVDNKSSDGSMSPQEIKGITFTKK